MQQRLAGSTESLRTSSSNLRYRGDSLRAAPCRVIVGAKLRHLFRLERRYDRRLIGCRSPSERVRNGRMTPWRTRGLPSLEAGLDVRPAAYSTVRPRLVDAHLTAKRGNGVSLSRRITSM